ncbi:GNAT family N-acetyltransferase [Streptomyces bryophytorum]|uniref:Aminoglycoside 2'-N-acetyltransferase n=1 Tax=Actinacidiphila bryophytorum TaxID=1436133 RepID=A0A9W4E5Q6_9ACTN|nr:GNAT family N-acetyltransferase [Actinacidiphila bryophytorum]MBN6545413.1 GNAT family N-acetyltransferase [Actinacidiphila bryophytorum]CAG7626563.1 Aminoglycoside 2'-N-acetyltransferase [Actinacidiphila bryophytorum]
MRAPGARAPRRRQDGLVAETFVRTVHTADLTPAQRAQIRVLLDGAFAGHPDGGFTDADWDHTLGGLHTVVLEGDEPIGHASVVQRRLLHGDRALRTGYVEAVAVRSDRRGQGHGAAVMAVSERIIRDAYDLGALGSATDATGFYASRGWHRWPGRTSALTPTGVVRTPDEDGAIYVYPVTPLDFTAELICDWRDGDVW